MAYNEIMQALGATPGQGGGPEYRDTHSGEMKFIDWLRAMGIDPTSLDPQVKLMYYQYWQEMQAAGNPNARRPPEIGGMRGMG